MLKRCFFYLSLIFLVFAFCPYIHISLNFITYIQSICFPVAALSLLFSIIAILIFKKTKSRIYVLISIVFLSSLSLCIYPNLSIPKKDMNFSAKDEVRAMSFNAEVSRANIDDLANKINTNNIDIAFLVEANEEFVDKLLPKISLKYKSSGVNFHAIGSSVILTKEKQVECQNNPFVMFMRSNPCSIITIDNKQITLYAIHTQSPIPEMYNQWVKEIGELKNVEFGSKDSKNLIMGGDFNSSNSHPLFRDFKEHSIIDNDTLEKCSIFGLGCYSWNKELFGLPFLQLDHILTSNFKVISTSIIDIQNSDHRAIYSILSI